ncbi:MAG: hypothetical protein RL266_1364 [Bacteroidota bacterium]
MALVTESLFAQCTGAQSATVTPAPNGTCIPGTVYTFCYTMNGYNQLGVNWVDGFEIVLSGPWVPGSLTGTTPPVNCNGGGGNWIWANSVTGTASGQQHGTGYYFDLNPDGNPGNDFGDSGPGCTWTICFQATVGNSPGSSLSVSVTALSDGEVGSWNSFACNGTPYQIFSCVIDEPCGTLTTVVNQNETCPGDANGQATATLTGGVSPFAYSWNTVPVQNSATANNLTAGTYTVTVTDANACVINGNVTITSGSAVDATINNINPNNQLCQLDNPIQLSTTQSGGTFSGPGVSSSGLFSPALANIGVNSISYTIGGPCPDTQTLDITVIPNADATIDPVGQLCTGNAPVQLTAASIGGTWSGTGVSSSGLFDPALAGAGTHTITYAVANPCGDTQTIDISVSDLLVSTSSTASICTADNGTASVTVISGTGPYSFSWNSVPTQTTQVATDLPAGTYDVTTSDNNGCSVTSSIIVPFDSGNLSVNTSATASVCTADNGTALATVSGGTAPFIYSWNTSPTQTTSEAIDLAPGNFDVSVVDNNGCTATASVNIPLDPSNLSVVINSIADVSCNGACDGSILSTALGGNPPFLYVWDDPSNQTSALASDLCAGNYNVGVIDVNGCLATAQAAITEPAVLSVSATLDQESDCGQPTGAATATGTGGSSTNGYQFEWSTNPPQYTATASGLVPNTYTATITDENGCTASTTVVVTSTADISVSIVGSTDALCYGSCDGTATALVGGTAVLPVTYSWNSAPAQTSATASGLCAGNYTVTATDNVGCLATATVSIGQPIPLLSQVSSSENQLCIGQSTGLTASVSGGTPPYTITNWSASPTDNSLVPTALSPTVSPITTTTYTFDVTDANGCNASSQNITVSVYQPLSLDAIRPLFSPDTGICPYDFAVIDLAASGGDGNYSYYQLPDVTNPIQFPMTVQPNTTASYDFVVTDGCTTPPATLTSTITVFQLPNVVFNADILEGCEPHMVQFADQTVPTPAAWNWTFGDVTSTANYSNQENPSHTFMNDGYYDVSLSVTSTDGCVSDTSYLAFIEVFPLPTANFEATPERTTVLLATIEFSDQSTGNIASWDWNFGDGEISDIQNPVNVYTDTGTFPVSLHVITVDGCEDIHRGQIQVDPDFMFYVPNAFSPNADGRNDSFRGYGEGVNWDTYEMSVYNRWGEEIFFTSSIDNPWDGLFKGQEAPQDVYVWQIQLYDNKGEKHTYRGRVTLYR